jgi:uncharacterized protein YjbI with pentapeptide repeats
MAAAQLDWERCNQDDCTGVRLPAAAWCLAHAAEQAPDAFDAELKRIGAEGTVDARGVVISAELFAQLLATAPRRDDQPTFTAARFDQATFQSEARFTGVSFQGEAGFDGARFQGDAGFERATFQGEAAFKGASFQGEARFRWATFQGAAWFFRVSFQGAAWFIGASFQATAWFHDASFQGGITFNKASFQGDTTFGEVSFQGMAGFDEASFQGVAWFGGASFQDVASFDGASFRDDVTFEGTSFRDDATFEGTSFQGDATFTPVTFQGEAWFTGASFQGEAEFGGASFEHDVTFDRARFERAEQLGPLLAYRGLVLDRVQFTRPVQIEAAAIGVCCRGAGFPGGVQFRLRWARVALDDTDLAAPSILASIPALADERLAEQEQQIARAWQRLLGDGVSPQPRLLSLRRANVAGLLLAGVDLTDCRFGSAHNLDKLRFEAEVSFGIAPTRLAWDTRQVIADERAWRAQHARRWTAPAYPQWVDAWLGQRRPSVIEPAQIAGLYRMLRKGREDSKDEPGAADFYYGETEMRRHAHRGRTSGASRGRVERGILTAYWLVSGYGLRAWRALAWLLVVLLTATAAMRAVGFTDHRQSWSSALLYTAGAVTRLVNPPGGLLTEPGQAIRLVVGLLGPILLALALLALRGRVKR